MGVAWSLVGLVPHFIPILIAWALWGFGYTFTSGAYEAWITDEVGSDKVGPVFVRGQRLSYAGALLGLGSASPSRRMTSASRSSSRAR